MTGNAAEAIDNAVEADVAILGLGLMGQAIAAAFLRAGRPTTVWNRTPGKAGDLITQGARSAPLRPRPCRRPQDPSSCASRTTRRSSRSSTPWARR